MVILLPIKLLQIVMVILKKLIVSVLIIGQPYSLLGVFFLDKTVRATIIIKTKLSASKRKKN